VAGLISEPAGDPSAQWQDMGSQVPSSVLDATPWLRDTSLVASSIGNAAATYGTLDDYGRAVSPPEATIPAADANKQYGIPGRLSFANDVAPSVAQEMNTAKHAEMVREDAAARRPGGFVAGAAGFGAGTAAMLLDPLDIASLLVPVLPEGRIAEAVAGAGLEGLAGRTVARVAAGAGSGALQQAALSAPRYALSAQEQADYSASDVLWDTLYGGLLGGAAHGGLGALREGLGGTDEVTQAFLRTRLGQVMATSPDARMGVMNAALAAVADERPVDVEALGELMAEGRIPPETGLPPVPGEATTARATPFEPENEPRRLIEFLRQPQTIGTGLDARTIPGGLIDDGGDISAIIGGSKGRPGLLNGNGQRLDDATLRAWQAGYFPEHSERPEINDLLDAIRDDHNGVARYSMHDADAVSAFEQSKGANEEILRLSDETGISTANKTRAQFFDAVADHMSVEDAAREVEGLEEQHAEMFAELEHEAAGDVETEPRSLEELESEHRQADAAEAAGQGRAAAGRPGSAGGGPEAGEALGGYSGRAAGDAGRAGPESLEERIADSETVRQAGGGLPHDEEATSEAAERAAAAPPQKAGVVPPEIQTHIDELTDSLARADAAGLLTAADRAEIQASDGMLGQAMLIGQGAMQAASCIARGLS
jgi:hypothetical protein